VQSWLWEQPTAARRPYYKTNAYACWNAALFKPDKDTDWSHALVMGRGYYTLSAYGYNFANRAGLTVLVVARWAGQQGTQNWQHMLAKGIDSYQGGYTTSSGWSLVISEKGAVGVSASHQVRTPWGWSTEGQDTVLGPCLGHALDHFGSRLSDFRLTRVRRHTPAMATATTTSRTSP
jgi:hypothetical protein